MRHSASPRNVEPPTGVFLGPACYGRGVKTELRITGMTCKNCVRHVESALRKRPGVAQVAVDLERGLAVVEHGDEVTASALCEVVADAGYQGVPSLVDPT